VNNQVISFQTNPDKKISVHLLGETSFQQKRQKPSFGDEKIGD
jgi:hypothetical protein